MKAIRLWLEKDKDIPRFERLCFRIEQISLSKTLKQGIHPVGHTRNIYGSECSHLPDKLGTIINNNDLCIPGISEFDFCSEIHLRSTHSTEWDEDGIKELLGRIRDSVYFVDTIDFQGLFEIARERIRKIWDYFVARSLLMETQGEFNRIREFLKSKDKAIKLSGYEDLKKYPLHKILSPADFEEHERIIITHALPILNFRKSGFIEKISNKEGYLSLVPEITDFQLVVSGPGTSSSKDLVYNCKRKSDLVSLMPDIEGKEEKRPLARQITSRWGEEGRKYCFHVNLCRLEEMISSGQFLVLFPSLTYLGDNAQVSRIRLRKNEIDKYRIGEYVSSSSTADEIKEVLKAFGISQTGKKEELLKKLMRHAAEVYNLKRFELDEYFSKKRFIYIPCYSRDVKDGFKVLEGSPMQNLLISMYALQHMRGNTILEAGHENNAYEARDLARAVINGSVVVQGTFVRVEDG